MELGLDFMHSVGVGYTTCISSPWMGAAVLDMIDMISDMSHGILTRLCELGSSFALFTRLQRLMRRLVQGGNGSYASLRR